MKIYPKILFITLPLIVISVLATGIVTHTISRSAIRAVVEKGLALRLDPILAACRQADSEGGEPAEQARRRIITLVKTINFEQSGNIFIVNKAGLIVSHSSENIEGMDVSSRGWFAEMQDNRSGNIQFILEGKKHWGVYALYKPWNWYLISNGEKKDLAGPIAQLGATTLVLALFCLIGAALPLFILARKLTGPIYNLIEGTEIIRAGNLDTHIGISSSDEIGILAGAFNATTARLRETIESLEERNAQLHDEISVRIRIQEELAKSEMKYRAIFDNAVEGIFQSKKDGRYLNVNRSFAAILGYDSPEQLSAEISDIGSQVYVSNEDRSQFIKLLESQELVTGFECRIWRRDGSIGWISMSARAIRDRSGNIKHIDGYCIDITAQKETEDEKHKLEEQLLQSQKMEALGNLTGGIAHDFNNLLQAITGYIQLLLLRKTEDDPDYKYLSEVDRASHRASELVGRLLLFSRKMKVKPIRLDLNQVVVDVCSMLQRTIPKMIEIDLQLEDDLERLKADPVQIEQILLNLVTNAVDAMDGRGQLLIRTEKFNVDQDQRKRYLELSSGIYIRLSVSDSGPGIDKATRERIFEPFFTTKEPGRGTGLGLSTVYGIVKGHQGHIACYSEENVGTTFDIYFPISPQIAMAEEQEQEPYDFSLEGSGTILLVDDEKLIVDIGEEVLTRHGYTVITGESGEEALKIYNNRSEEIDLVLMDLGMPGMGGEECLDKLKTLSPDLKIIVASGYTGHKIAKAPQEAGAVAFLPKPYSLNKLLLEMRKWLPANR